MLGVGEDHPTFDARHLRSQLLGEGHEGRIDEDQPVLGVADDVDELVGEEARIERVTDRAHAGHAEVEFDVAMAVPRQGSDPIADTDAEPAERLGETLRALVGLAVAVAMDRTLARARDDLGVGVVVAGVLDQVRDQEREIHHQSAHTKLLRGGR